MQKPNIIIVNCDDLGYGDLGCYGSKMNKTPAIDKMAAEGIKQSGFANVSLIKTGLSDNKGTMKFVAGRGGGSHVGSAGDTTIAIESLDMMNIPEKITFIKMDIEGSELEALKGAKNIIKKDQPKLAICVYHKPEDIIDIPLYIKSLVPEYQLYLRHYSGMSGETVLYAVL